MSGSIRRYFQMFNNQPTTHKWSHKRFQSITTHSPISPQTWSTGCHLCTSIKHLYTMSLFPILKCPKTWSNVSQNMVWNGAPKHGLKWPYTQSWSEISIKQNVPDSSTFVCSLQSSQSLKDKCRWLANILHTSWTKTHTWHTIISNRTAASY